DRRAVAGVDSDGVRIHGVPTGRRIVVDVKSVAEIVKDRVVRGDGDVQVDTVIVVEDGVLIDLRAAVVGLDPITGHLSVHDVVAGDQHVVRGIDTGAIVVVHLVAFDQDLAASGTISRNPIVRGIDIIAADNRSGA